MIKENEFRQFLKEDNNCSEATIHSYISDLTAFEAFIVNQGKSLVSCSGNDILDYLSQLRSDNKKASTLNRKMVAIRKYFEYLRFCRICDNNPCKNLKVPKVEKKSPDYLSIEDIEKLLNSPENDEKGLRDKAILELFYACGLKVSELTNLNIQDIDLRIGFVSCRGSNAKNRIIPIGHQAKNALLTYMKDIRPKYLEGKQDEGALFLNYNGERITRQGVWKMFKHYGKKTGISEDLSPQLIRNSFAAHMIMNGADLKSLQELLGNEDIGAAELFLSLAKTRVMDVYDKTHPRA